MTPPDPGPYRPVTRREVLLAGVVPCWRRWPAATPRTPTGQQSKRHRNVHERGEPELFAAQPGEPHQELRRRRPCG
jgi:hypothetical protein